MPGENSNSDSRLVDASLADEFPRVDTRSHDDYLLLLTDDEYEPPRSLIDIHTTDEEI